MSEGPIVPDPAWPTNPYCDYPKGEFGRWLTFKKEIPVTGRPSRRVSHIGVPYTVRIQNAPAVSTELLQEVAANYLRRVQDFLEKDNGVENGLDLPPSWRNALFPADKSSIEENYIRWLPIWPAVGGENTPKPEFIGSWNLSRDTDTHQLPASIILTAAEATDNGATMDVLSYSVGLRLPMEVTRDGNDLDVTIRTMTAELPRQGHTSFSEWFRQVPDKNRDDFVSFVNGFVGYAQDGSFDAQIAAASGTDENSISVEEFWPRVLSEADLIAQDIRLSLRSKARSKSPRSGAYQGFQVQSEVTEYIVGENGTIQPVFGETTKAELVTHATHAAEVFVQTPSGWQDASDPPPDYDWTLRRPPREDGMLDPYLVERQVPTKLDGDGFEIRLCPQLVPEDRAAAANNKTVKEVTAAELADMPPRRNEFAAVNAYCNAVDFFSMLSAFDIEPSTFVIHADDKVSIFYRAGITPGPGGGGRTINAQVKFDPPAQPQPGNKKPAIEINLALANLNRWDRPEQPDGRRKWAEPLGIAASGRWMLHEFAHYLLAARIGQLEFDFCHSAGDGMAAVAFDPISRLADPRAGAATSFRGVTYPFVFSTRRHDRTPLLGWAWYGGLNRSVIDAAPTDGFRFKSYLTEQILSSTLFRLYRVLGGDTLVLGDPVQGPDQEVRQRASFVTLYLLIRAIDGFAQSPSMAEFLELGMEEVDTALKQPLTVGDYRSGAAQPVAWRGGLANKAVHWAFEAQGMFPADPSVAQNNVGQPPEVDIYIADRRPDAEDTSVGPVEYGPGSYCPVSLDWGDNPRWLMADTLIFGNRGSEIAQNVMLRIWVGKISGDPSTSGWDDDPNHLEWKDAVFDLNLGNIPPTNSVQREIEDLPPRMQNAMTEPGAIVLFEITCADDHANTDPAKDLAVALEVQANQSTPNLPETPRALTELVANDNNLGLWRA